MKLINKLLILIIRFYKYFISPYFPSNCRYLPTCSEYFIESIKINGIFIGSYFGLKRILSCHPIKILGGKRILRCHPIKFLGGNSGYDPAPDFKKGKK